MPAVALDVPSPSRARTLGAWVLTALAAAPLGSSAFAKLAAVPEVQANFEKARLLPYLKPIGALELVVVALLLVPRTASLGILLVTGYLGGAIVTHLESGEPVMAAVPAVLGLLAWSGYFLRNPEMFASFSRR